MHRLLIILILSRSGNLLGNGCLLYLLCLLCVSPAHDYKNSFRVASGNFPPEHPSTCQAVAWTCRELMFSRRLVDVVQVLFRGWLTMMTFNWNDMSRDFQKKYIKLNSLSDRQPFEAV